jgi:hypothetical protein
MFHDISLFDTYALAFTNYINSYMALNSLSGSVTGIVDVTTSNCVQQIVKMQNALTRKIF